MRRMTHCPRPYSISKIEFARHQGIVVDDEVKAAALRLAEFYRSVAQGEVKFSPVIDQVQH